MAQHISDWLQAGSINIFGMPFSGKDTQARRLAAILHAQVIGGGDILRSHPDQKTINRLSATGELFPSDYYLGIILPYLSQDKFKGQPLILSAVGRWSGEENSVMQAAEKAGHPLKAVIFLNLSEDEIWQRFEIAKARQDRGKRADDAGPQILEVRFKEFAQKTRPVIDFYRSKGLLLEVDGQGNPEVVTQKIIELLREYANAQIN